MFVWQLTLGKAHSFNKDSAHPPINGDLSLPFRSNRLCPLTQGQVRLVKSLFTQSTFENKKTEVSLIDFQIMT
jgi:hypothetical protein